MLCLLLFFIVSTLTIIYCLNFTRWVYVFRTPSRSQEEECVPPTDSESGEEEVGLPRPPLFPDLSRFARGQQATQSSPVRRQPTNRNTADPGTSAAGNHTSPATARGYQPEGPASRTPNNGTWVSSSSFQHSLIMTHIFCQ